MHTKVCDNPAFGTKVGRKKGPESTFLHQTGEPRGNRADPESEIWGVFPLTGSAGVSRSSCLASHSANMKRGQRTG